jgi:hypothetical protein
MSDLTPRSHRGIGNGMMAHGRRLQHGKPQWWGARPQPDAREGQAGPPGVADRLVVPGKPGNSGGGKGPEFKEAARRGKGQGEWRKPIHLLIKRSGSEGGDPQSPRVPRGSPVFPCPRAGCGKSARPGSMSGEQKRSVSHRAAPRLYRLRSVLARVYHVGFDKNPIDTQWPCRKSRRIPGLCRTAPHSDPSKGPVFCMT